MDVTPLISSKNAVIQSYGTNGFKISGKTYDHPVLVRPRDVSAWQGHAFDSLNIEDFKDFPKDIDVLFIGTGKDMKHLPPALKAQIKEQKINVETMDTGAACRTFNVLMSDGREIAALLFVPQN